MRVVSLICMHICIRCGWLSCASISRFGRSWDLNLSVQILVEWNQWLYFGSSSQALNIVRIEQGLVCSVSGMSGHCAGSLVSQWGSTIQSPRICSVRRWCPSQYDLRYCQDKKRQITNQLNDCDVFRFLVELHKYSSNTS